MENATNGISVPPQLSPLYDLARKSNNKDDVFSEISRLFPGITKKDLLGRNRDHRVSRPRQMAFFVLHDVLKMTHKEIAVVFDDRDHSTVVYGVGKMREEIDSAGLKREVFAKDLSNGSPTQGIVRITDYRDMFYFLGDVKVFPSILDSHKLTERLGKAYGHDGFKIGPAIDIASKRRLHSPLSAGLYVHERVALSPQDLERYAPLLGTKESFSLEKVLNLR